MIQIECIENAWENYRQLECLQRSPLIKTRICSRFAWHEDDPYSVRALLVWHLEEISRTSKRIANNSSALQWVVVDNKSIESYVAKYKQVGRVRNISSKRAAQKRIKRAKFDSANALSNLSTSTEVDPAHYPTIVRYKDLTRSEKLSIQYLSLFHNPEARTILELATEPEVSRAMPRLLKLGLVIASESGFFVRYDSKDWLKQQLKPSDKKRWLAKIGRLYRRERPSEPMLAIDYFLEAQNWQAAAHLLDTRRRHLWKAVSLDVLQERIEASALDNISPRQQVRLRLLYGQVAELRDELSTAETEYRRALSIARGTYRELHAEALYHLAHVLQQNNVTGAIRYLIELQNIAGLRNRWQISGALLLAWLNIEQRIDMDEGYRILTQVVDETALITDELRYRYHNTWAEYFRRSGLQQSTDLYLKHARMAYAICAETENITDRLMAQYNLGLAYFGCGQLDNARAILEENYVAAQQRDNRFLIALNRLTLANLLTEHYKAFEESIPAYLEAEDYFRVTNHLRPLAGTLVGLTWAYVELGRISEARQTFIESSELANDLQHKRVAEAVRENEIQYPELTHELTANQIKALRYLRKNQEIANRTYCELCGVGNAAANRHLQKMVQLGIIQRVGQGRSTRYCLKVT